MNRKVIARLTAVLLAVVLVLSLAGCSSADKTSVTAEENASAVSETMTETSPKPAKEKSAKKTKKLPSVSDVSETTSGQTGTSSTKKTGTTSNTKQKATTKSATKAAPKSGSLVADVYDLSTNAARQLLNGTVDFGSGGLQYLDPVDTGISVRVRSKRNSAGGVQLYLIVKNNTGRAIRLNGNSKFAIRDLLGNELLSTNIRLNQPVVMEDQDEQILSITLPRDWYAFDDLYQLTVEAGIFQSLIALDYDFV